MQTSTARSGYFPHIDGLRAIAVLAVIVYHLDPRWLPGGFLGVDVFFVISGFVVSASVDRLPPVSAAAGLLRFYARRLRRIAPALLACLLVTALVSALFIPESWLSETSDRTGRMAFVGLSNWVLASTGNDYFSPRTEFNPYMHTWSLGVEEQFYLLFPWLFLLWARGARARTASLLLVVLSCVASLGFACWRAQVPGQEIAAFYLTGTRLWQLGAGVLLYQAMAASGVFARGLALPGGLRAGLMLLALAAIATGFWAARPGHSPWPDGAWAVLGTLAVLAFAHGPAGQGVGRWLAWPALVAIGRWSYSLYLWHWPVLVVLRWTCGLEAGWTKGLALGLTFALALASYRWVETPFRRGVMRWPDRRWVMAGVAALVLAGGIQALVVKATPYLSLSVVSRHPLDWYAYAKGLRKEFPGCRLSNSTEVVDGVLVRSFAGQGCPGHAATGRRLFVVGDSHAMAYNELLRRYALGEGVAVRLYGTGGCAVADLQAWGGSSPACQAFLQAALGDVGARATSGDVVFLPGLRMPRLADQDELFDFTRNLHELQSADAQAGRAQLVAATAARLRPLADAGVRIVLEAPKPLLQAPPYRCSDWFNRGNAVCRRGAAIDRASMEQYRAPALQGLQTLARDLPGARLWDPLPLLCDATQCSGRYAGRPLYFDADHLSGYGNRHLLASFSAAMDQAYATP